MGDSVRHINFPGSAGKIIKCKKNKIGNKSETILQKLEFI